MSEAARSNWLLWSLLLPALAVPGALNSLWGGIVLTTPFFGEEPSPIDRATAAAAMWSGVSLCLFTAIVTAIVSRRFVAPALCGVAALGLALLVLTRWDTSVPLSSAEFRVGWAAAWWSPTSWIVVVVAVVLPVRSAYRAVSHRRSSSRSVL
ncbi:hypothetical protein GCM10010399_88290 [Dactylosporangium fulvum]|uniref:Uncharacterized protein n=1 Tax=Dactylosporangium fulvum TaxID=53359 RepID=A0ABY5W5U0_9ACTN|nr:hypothetical protein [Dactylosporangium fulvum]UWP85432.1 hypothetical protein Dfulv_14810 [Dactylosporangium fulvum]